MISPTATSSGETVISSPFLRTHAESYIHKGRDRAAAFADGDALEQFSDLVEQHYRHRFRILGNSECSDRGYRHQKALVKCLTVRDVADRRPYNGVSYHRLRHRKYEKIHIPCKIRICLGDPCGAEKHRRYDYAAV